MSAPRPTCDIPGAVDWRGNPYGVGDLIVYPRMSGRCAEIQEAVVVRIYARQDEWSEEWRPRVEVQPTGRGSRDFYRTDELFEWLDADGNPTTWELAARDPDTQRYRYRKTPMTPKPVTLTIIENVTVLMRERHGV